LESKHPHALSTYNKLNNEAFKASLIYDLKDIDLYKYFSSPVGELKNNFSLVTPSINWKDFLNNPQYRIKQLEFFFPNDFENNFVRKKKLIANNYLNFDNPYSSELKRNPSHPKDISYSRWKNYSAVDKLSNIEVSLSLQRLSGFISAFSDYTYLFDMLAQVEHKRWYFYKLVNNTFPMIIKDIRVDFINGKFYISLKDSSKRYHACMTTSKGLFEIADTAIVTMEKMLESIDTSSNFSKEEIKNQFIGELVSTIWTNDLRYYFYINFIKDIE